MKRLLVTDNIKRMANEYALKVIKQLNPEEKLRDLQVQLHRNEAEYVGRIIDNLPAILEMLPWDYDNFHLTVFADFDKSGTKAIDLSKSISFKPLKKKAKTQQLYKHIISALGYDKVQGEIFPEYIRKLDIRSCVYCNAQYAVSTKKGSTGRSRKFHVTFDLDHWMPKDKFPYLGVAFFNLYPSCPACNRGHSDRSKKWCLYAQEGEEQNPYRFKIDDQSLLKYLLDWDAETLKIDFVDGVTGSPAIYDGNDHIEKIYNNFKDVVEEVIWRKRIYSAKMIEAMQQSGVYELKPHDVYRYIIGNYDREEDMLKRPLAKLIQDVAKQLELI